MEAKGQGDILLRCILPTEEYKTITLGKVLYVRDLQKSLSSVPSIAKNGGSVHFSREKCEISTKEGLLGVGHKEGNLYLLGFEESSFHATTTTTKSTGNKCLEHGIYI